MSPADARMALAMLGDAWSYGQAARHGALTKWERRAYVASALTMYKRGVAVASGTPVVAVLAIAATPAETGGAS